MSPPTTIVVQDRTVTYDTLIHHEHRFPASSTLHHCPTDCQGHLEFFICDTGDLADPGGVATQECFNKYPLTRADGDDDNSPIDPDYPGRYYVDPPCRQEETKYERHIKSEGGYVMKMKYKLPEDLVCGHCVLQTWYCECFVWVPVLGRVCSGAMYQKAELSASHPLVQFHSLTHKIKPDLHNKLTILKQHSRVSRRCAFRRIT